MSNNLPCRSVLILICDLFTQKGTLLELVDEINEKEGQDGPGSLT